MESKECITTDCPIKTTLEVMGGKWKPSILWELRQQDVLRFGQIKKLIPDITQKMLTQQLRELEADDIVSRKIYAEVPPRVEYRITDYGKSLAPILHEMAQWGNTHRRKKHSLAEQGKYIAAEQV